jgi:hypothetical protein
MIVGCNVQARDALLSDMEPWKNWDLSESRVMEKHFTEITMHGTTVIKLIIQCFSPPFVRFETNASENGMQWQMLSSWNPQPELGFHIQINQATTFLPGTQARQTTLILSL